MKTVTVQIGNSDDKLTQREWSKFVAETGEQIRRYSTAIHFFGGAVNYAEWQNVAWVFNIPDEHNPLLKKALGETARYYLQDSIAWTEGVTQIVFAIRPSERSGIAEGGDAAAMGDDDGRE